MNDRLMRLAVLGGAVAALLWAASLFVLEAAGNPADPTGGEEIAEFYRDDRTAILIAASVILWRRSGIPGEPQAAASP